MRKAAHERPRASHVIAMPSSSRYTHYGLTPSAAERAIGGDVTRFTG
jgi:hypothetical protein